MIFSTCSFISCGSFVYDFSCAMQTEMLNRVKLLGRLSREIDMFVLTLLVLVPFPLKPKHELRTVADLYSTNKHSSGGFGGFSEVF
jgi:hypothetical protein